MLAHLVFFEFFVGASQGITTATAAITGTITASATEADIRAGGKTIIITLTNDTWAAAGASFDAQRQNIINGLTSAQAAPLGWNAVVRAGLAVGAVVRTSATVVTITLSAFSNYEITSPETITVTAPKSAMVIGTIDIVATPTFGIATSAAVATDTHDGVRRARKRLDEEAKDKRERAKRLHDRIIDAYGAITGDRVVPAPQAIARAEAKIERDAKDIHADGDTIDQLRAQLVAIRRDVAMLQELEKNADDMQERELADIRWILGQL